MSTASSSSTEASLESALGYQPHPLLFRAPHGFRNPFVARATSRRGYAVVGWTKGVWDTAKPGVEAIVRRTTVGFRPGGILLLHDADGSGDGDDRSQTVEAVPEIVERAHAAGYELVTVSELATKAPAQAHGAVAHRPRARALRRAARAGAAHRRPQHRQRDQHRLVVGARIARAQPGLDPAQGGRLEGRARHDPGPPPLPLRATSCRRSSSASCSTRCCRRASARSGAWRCCSGACGWRATTCRPRRWRARSSPSRSCSRSRSC